MTMKDICTWTSVPDDLILGGMWYIEAIDKPNNTVKFKDENLDVYVKSVNIPLNSIEMEKTNFGRLNIKERNFPESINITFVDSSDHPWLKKFQKWLDSIFDFENNEVVKTWRNQGKNFIINQVKIVNKKDISKAYNPVAGVNAMINAFKGIDLSEVEVHKIASFEIQEAYITKIEDLEFSSEENGAKEFSIELECECVTPTYYDVSEMRIIN